MDDTIIQLKLNGNYDDTKNQILYKQVREFRRYKNALNNVIPIRSNVKNNVIAPVDRAGLISTIFYSWISKVMYKAHRKEITIDELPALSPYDAGIYNADRLSLMWERELKIIGHEKASFSKVAWRFCRTAIYSSCLVFTGSLIAGLISYTLVMRKLLEYVESGNGLYQEGIKWSVLLIIAEISRTLFLGWSWALNYRSALRLRSACLTLLYRKVIRVNNLESENIGKVINMFSNDAQRIFDVIVFGPMIVGAPISTIFGVVYILWLLGPMAFIGMAAFIIFFPIQYAISRLAGYLQDKTVKISDMRVRLMNEMLDCIKLIKMYAWEKRFSQDLLDTRKNELKVVVKTSLCKTLSGTLSPAMPVLSAIITFLAHVSSGNNLTAAQVFSYTTLLDSGIRLSLCFFQDAIQAIVAAKISFNRMKSLLLLEEGNCDIFKSIIESQALGIINGTFTYNISDYQNEKTYHQTNRAKGSNVSASLEVPSDKKKQNQSTDNTENTNVLFDINFSVEEGKLIGICGPVGSGKSSLLLAALGQLRISDGRVTRNGSCAYVSQQAWITNATLRDNILFGENFDQIRYDKTINACSLSQDISMMPGGDQTEIGEKGVNLSGGQKQRVALARALYADRDIYFLDDPLSAVDSRVGSYIFDNLILGALKEKTVLFVTHQIQYLNRCDEIYMMRNGRIIEHGTHDELMEIDNEYSSMVAAIFSENNTDDDNLENEQTETFPQLVNGIPLANRVRSRPGSVKSHISEEIQEELNASGAHLTVADNLQQGTIKAETYYAYIMASGGSFFAFIVLLVYLVADASISFSPWWLALWIKAGAGNETNLNRNETRVTENIHDNPDFSYYRTIYASTIGMILITSIMRSLFFTKATIAASTKMHIDLFKKIISSPMRFFDTTPIGRIQHLFSRDMDEVDNRLPMSLSYMIQNFMMVFFAMLIISVVFPWFIIPLCILGTFYYFVSKIFRVAIRDLKRMDNKSRAPIISFTTATVQGLSTIHAFGKENDFIKTFSKIFDENSNCLFMYNAATRWLAGRIDGLSVAITGITAFLVIGLQGHVPPALAGLALAYSIQISGVFQYTIRTLSETEIRFISVERINHYLRVLKTEGSDNEVTVKPPPTWPSVAEIKFTNVCMSYGEGSPVILKNVNFIVNPGEKIGIVGRTGSGKSSLTVALFRLVELAEGKIEIDDVDVSKIDLEQLRTKLSIIPQDPILFSGTIRSNLDPFEIYSDAEIWEALEKTELKRRVHSIIGELDAPVGSGGDNLSVGERQLLCLSRALLRNSKILVLDEATAAVDPETEIAVQNTINQEFSNCTILTIAHRLQTVIPLDRILVMEDGKVLEFDTPSNLINDKNSEFSKMLAAAEKAERK